MTKVLHAGMTFVETSAENSLPQSLADESRIATVEATGKAGLRWQTRFRDYFPAAQANRYANIAYTSPLAPTVAAAIGDFLAGIGHARSAKPDWLNSVETVRERLAALIRGDARRLAFTANTCSAINLIAQGLNWQPNENVVINDQEHLSSLLPWLNLRSRGVAVRVVRAVDRVLDIDEIWKSVDEGTRVVALSWVQSTSGQRIDLAELSRRCLSNGIFLVVDGIQGLGLLQLDLHRTPLDGLAAGAHKGLLGPLGLGFVHLSEKLLNSLDPVYLGPSDALHLIASDLYRPDYVIARDPRIDRLDARRLETGNVNYPAVVGLGRALELIEEAGPARMEAWSTGLNADFDRRVRALGAEVMLPSGTSGVLSTSGTTTTTVRVPDAAAAVHSFLQQRGIIASLVETDHLRFSFAAYNTPEDVAEIAAVLGKAIT